MNALKILYRWLEARVGVRMFRLMRYVFSGGTAAASNVIALFILVEFAHLHYLSASILAFIFSLGISFTLHKFLTFRDRQTHGMHKQIGRYLLVILGNLALNTTLVYALVEWLDVWYLFAQIIGAALVAVTGYIGYKYFVFRESAPHSL
ncbi:GtrA family protein [Patescibacteria group bacterium]|nr:GtrA family protein [Patescibacteria group bacterium]